MFRQTQVGLFLVLLATALPLAGCGGGFGDVSGSVTLDGQPVPAGTVTFVDRTNTTQSDMFTDGKYHVTKVAAGQARVSVVTPMAITFGEPGGTKSAKVGDTKPPPAKSVTLPEKYQDHEKSGLVYEIKRGANTIDVEMKSK